MQIFITYDYELFFGTPSGTVEKCIIEPTNRLREIANRTNVKFVFFIDVGYLKKLNELKDVHVKVAHEYNLISQQIQTLVNEGHDCQLHIHPHWEDSTHNGEQWIMHVNRYKLVDFNDQEIERIVLEYQDILHNITKKPVNIYRAGGWCLQPFSRIKKAFDKAALKLDSSVFPGGKFTAGNYFYDFTSTPQKSIWNFQDDLCVENASGQFKEYPISSYKYSPLFFWRLFILGRLKPKMHKPIGDGYPMPSPGLRKKMLSQGALLSASCDGYFVTKLNKVIKQNQSKGFDQTVILGHPKACTQFALIQLEKFIITHKNKHEFLTFTQVI